MTIGVLVDLDRNLRERLKQVKSMGLSHCQLCCWDESLLTEETARTVADAVAQEGITVTTFWCGWPGPCTWDFIDGPITLGLVPGAYRLRRMEALMRGSDFAMWMGVDQIATHAGFIPENPLDPNYPGVIAALRHVVDHCRKNGQSFLFETGQETPVTLRRAIEDIGGDRIGVNYDPANFLLYGKANPIDALDILGDLVLDVHAKDGEYPADMRLLGMEKPLGQGRVDFPLMIAKLRDRGYRGAITIEREVAGEQQRRDVARAIDMLRALISG